MKKVIIKQFTHAEVDAEKEQFGFLKIPLEHKLIRAEGENLEVSDGYHTFDELYEHRIAIWQALLSAHETIADEWGEKGHEIWKSKLHSDGSFFDGWFVSGLMKDKGEQTTYHLPMSEWDNTSGRILEKAPEWDGHTPEDVIKRLKEL